MKSYIWDHRMGCLVWTGDGIICVTVKRACIVLWECEMNFMNDREDSNNFPRTAGHPLGSMHFADEAMLGISRFGWFFFATQSSLNHGIWSSNAIKTFSLRQCPQRFSIANYGCKHLLFTIGAPWQAEIRSLVPFRPVVRLLVTCHYTNNM